MAMLTGLPSKIMRMLNDESGATAIEYAFIVSLVSIGIGFMIPEIRAHIDELFLRTATGVTSAATDAQSP